MIRKHYKALELWYFDADNVPVYRYQGVPFTGVVEEYYDDRFTLSSEDEYVNGYQEGWIRTYHLNGQLKKYTNYHDGNNKTILHQFRENKSICKY